MDLSSNWKRICSTLCSEISFILPRRKLVFCYRWMPYQISVSQWYLFHWPHQCSEDWLNRRTLVERTISQRLCIFDKMGSCICLLRRQNIHIRRQIQQWSQWSPGFWSFQGSTAFTSSSTWKSAKAPPQTKHLFRWELLDDVWRFQSGLLQRFLLHQCWKIEPKTQKKSIKNLQTVKVR